jgi:hypothetical protein
MNSLTVENQAAKTKQLTRAVSDEDQAQTESPHARAAFLRLSTGSLAHSRVTDRCTGPPHQKTAMGDESKNTSSGTLGLSPTTPAAEAGKNPRRTTNVGEQEPRRLQRARMANPRAGA